MEENIIKAIIETGENGGFTAFSESVPGVYANGLTESEVREEFLSMMQEQAEDIEEMSGERPAWADAEVQFSYAISAMFSAFPFINATALGEWMGISPSLMRRYKAGLTAPKGKNKRIIVEHLSQLSDRLSEVCV